MIVLIKLILAHFIGDFLLQPKSWIDDKIANKFKSPKLYLHALIHFGLILLIVWDWKYWSMAVFLSITHLLIDLLKLIFQKPKSQIQWFLGDQILHLLSIFIFWYIYFTPEINFSEISNQTNLWIYITAIFFLTFVAGISIKILLAKWSNELESENDDSLNNAGKYIGILERLFVFTFIITGNWTAIGFLITAKSVFRFGDLRESKNRKLTEYILIGTLLSFAIAVATGMLVNYLTNSAVQ